MNGEAEYLTSTDAANALSMSANGVRAAANSGRLTVAARTPGGVRLFLRSEVERFAKSRKARR